MGSKRSNDWDYCSEDGSYVFEDVSSESQTRFSAANSSVTSGSNSRNVRFVSPGPGEQGGDRLRWSDTNAMPRNSSLRSAKYQSSHAVSFDGLNRMETVKERNSFRSQGSVSSFALGRRSQDSSRSGVLHRLSSMHQYSKEEKPVKKNPYLNIFSGDD